MNQLCLAVKVLLIGLLFAVPVWAGDPNQPEPWDTGAGSYEADPADGDAVGQGDDHFRAMKREIRDRVEVEHHFGSVAGDDTGLHRLGSARGFFQSAVPTALEVADHDNDGGGPGDTTLANQDYQSQEIKGLGRFWVDSDTNELWIYTDKVELEDSASSAGFVPASVGQYNFLYNGSFEISASGAASPSIPDGWTNDGLATTATQATGITEGSGFAFNGIANSANDALTQTLLGEGLKPSTTYLVYGRVSPQVTTCSIVTTGAGTQADVTSASGGGVWETLLDTFITDANAPPTDVVVRLESDANGSDCDWDHIFVVEYMPRRLLPERLYDIDCVAWTSDAVTEPALEALTVRFRNPWPSAVVKLGAQNIVADQNNSNTILEWERPSGTEIATYERPRDDGTTPSRHNITMPYMDVNLVPGTEYVYQIDIDATLVDPGISSPVAASICIWLEAYPL